jgi:hypothetical protein
VRFADRRRRNGDTQADSLLHPIAISASSVYSLRSAKSPKLFLVNPKLIEVGA